MKILLTVLLGVLGGHEVLADEVPLGSIDLTIKDNNVMMTPADKDVIPVINATNTDLLRRGGSLGDYKKIRIEEFGRFLSGNMFFV